MHRLGFPVVVLLGLQSDSNQKHSIYIGASVGDEKYQIVLMCTGLSDVYILSSSSRKESSSINTKCHHVEDREST